MKVDYKVIRTERENTTITVERDRSVIVRAPWRASDKAISNAIERKKFWIYQKTNHPQKYDIESLTKEFISGASALYLGRNYRMEIVDTEEKVIKFRSKFLLPSHLKHDYKELFKKWYIERAYKKVVPKVEYFAENLGVEYNKVMISDLKVRWGSCTPKNNLNFNWRLIKAPMYVIDYVITHELAHLLESNHTLRFWNIVKTHSDSSLKAKEWLKQYGGILEKEI